MFTKQILESILSLKTFSATAQAHTPALEGIHISVNAATKTITALATDQFAAARMVISVPEVDGTSWDRNVSIAALKAALAAVKAGGRPVSSFPGASMQEFPAAVTTIIDRFVIYEDAPTGGDFNAKYLGAISKVDVGGDKSGRWTIRTVSYYNTRPGLAATATHGNYEVAVAVMPLPTRN